MGTHLVTGSASGIGAACRRHLEADGHTVIGVDRHDAELVLDLATGEGRAALVGQLEQLAPDGLDGAVAAAGIGPHERPLSCIVATNLFGALATIDAVAAPVARRGGAAVVICSNSAGLTPVEDPALLDALDAESEGTACARIDEFDGPLMGAVAYGASKAALGRAMRRRAGHWGAAGARLNAVAPGPVRTPLLQGSHDDPELGPLVDALPVPWGTPPSEPDDIARIVVFLLSARSAPVHGAVLFADGGTDAVVRPDHV